MSTVSSIQMFEKPLGMRDMLPEIFEKVEAIRQTGRSYLHLRGYDFIQTPTVEYYDTIGNASAIVDASLFKLVDNQGNTLVLRPDMTTPIIRAATSKLLKEKTPLRLAYFANVFRAQELEGGRPSEFEQMGIELIGDKSVFADAEVVMTAIGLLKQYGLADFKVTIGHAGILQCILNDYTESAEQAARLRYLLVQRNYVGFEEAVNAFDLPQTKSNALLQFIGEATHITKISDIEKYVRKNDALEYMQQLNILLEEANLAQYIAFDFTLSSHMSYYTGMLFEVFASGSGFPLGNGGRYDGLLDVFGTEAGATGFGLRVDRLLEALNITVEKRDCTLILFDASEYKIALTIAKDLRQQNTATTLQVSSAVADVAALKSQFSKVIVITKDGVKHE